MKFLGPASVVQIELDYPLAAGAALAVVDQFITPAPLPNTISWQAGNYAVSLLVANANNVSFTIEIWRADALGNLLSQIGSRPALQTAAGAIPSSPVAVAFAIIGALLATSATDRLALKVLAQNNDVANANTFSVVASGSSLATPILIPDNKTNQFNPFRRNKFLGFVFRAGEGAPYFDKNGVDIVTPGSR